MYTGYAELYGMGYGCVWTDGLYPQSFWNNVWNQCQEFSCDPTPVLIGEAAAALDCSTASANCYTSFSGKYSGWQARNDLANALLYHFQGNTYDHLPNGWTIRQLGVIRSQSTSDWLTVVNYCTCVPYSDDSFWAEVAFAIAGLLIGSGGGVTESSHWTEAVSNVLSNIPGGSVNTGC